MVPPGFKLSGYFISIPAPFLLLPADSVSREDAELFVRNYRTIFVVIIVFILRGCEWIVKYNAIMRKNFALCLRKVSFLFHIAYVHR